MPRFDPILRPCAILILAGTISACSEHTSEAPPPKDTATTLQSPAPLTSVPLTLTAKQRTITPVPGSDPLLEISLGDITSGQVQTSLVTDRQLILPPRSMQVRDSIQFHFQDHTYQLTLTKLDNALIGEDFATFEITANVKLTESERIEQLILAVKNLDGAAFIRNGVDHPPAEAADHLRTKWERAGDMITTAEQFIDHLASHSSLSGEPYLIRLPDGQTIPAKDWLHDQLKEIDQQDQE